VTVKVQLLVLLCVSTATQVTGVVV